MVCFRIRCNRIDYADEKHKYMHTLTRVRRAILMTNFHVFYFVLSCLFKGSY